LYELTKIFSYFDYLIIFEAKIRELSQIGSKYTLIAFRPSRKSPRNTGNDPVTARKQHLRISFSIQTLVELPLYLPDVGG